MTERGARRVVLIDSALVSLVYAALATAARASGFDHISDDDFSRVTIAQAFAHAPRLDPSGTSWLPFPFWLLGSALALFGRSLQTARVVSIAVASLAAALPYLALRGLHVPRTRALAGVAFALGTPWCLWLGATTVPECFTAMLTATAAIGLGAVERPKLGRSMLFAGALGAATLSRYEPWPVAAVLAGALLYRSLRTQPRGDQIAAILTAVLCVLGPVAWMAWNAHAHDGPLHFFRRVSNYKRAIGEGATDPLAALWFFPKLFFTTRPEVSIPLVLLVGPALSDTILRKRWLVPLVSIAAELAFLSYGNARDGAPAHHAERALFGTWVLAALFVCDAGLVLFGRVAESRKVVALAGGIVIAVTWLFSVARGLEPPGRGATEDRREAIASGQRLRAANVSNVAVTPCAFEHFAWIAAYGAPENVIVEPRGATPPATCPSVDVREHSDPLAPAFQRDGQTPTRP